METLKIFLIVLCYLGANSYTVPDNPKSMNNLESRFNSIINGFMTGFLEEPVYIQIQSCIKETTNLTANLNSVFDSLFNYTTSRDLANALIKYLHSISQIDIIAEVYRCIKYSKELVSFIEDLNNYEIDRLPKKILINMFVFGVDVANKLVSFHNAIIAENYYNIGYFLGISIRYIIII